MIPMAAWNLLALNIGFSYAAHDCIHDTYIVPALREHEHFPFNVHQDEGDGHGRRLYESNATERSQLIRRRLAAGGLASADQSGLHVSGECEVPVHPACALCVERRRQVTQTLCLM